MNSSSDFYILIRPTGNSSYRTVPELLNGIGVLSVVQSLNNYLLVPTVLMECVLNAITFVIFRRKEYNMPIYFYWNPCVVDGWIGNVLELAYGLILGTAGLNYGYFSICLYLAHIFPYLNGTSLFYKLIVDLVLVLDRIALFKKPVKEFFFRFSPMTNSLIIAACVIVFNSSMSYFSEVYNYQLVDKAGELIPFCLPASSNFLKSLAGKILYNTLFAIRNVATLSIAQCGLSNDISQSHTQDE
jgi:hypothetical protein